VQALCDEKNAARHAPHLLERSDLLISPDLSPEQQERQEVLEDLADVLGKFIRMTLAEQAARKRRPENLPAPT
jgi:hypothetical protein